MSSTQRENQWMYPWWEQTATIKYWRGRPVAVLEQYDNVVLIREALTGATHTVNDYELTANQLPFPQTGELEELVKRLRDLIVYISREGDRALTYNTTEVLTRLDRLIADWAEPVTERALTHTLQVGDNHRLLRLTGTGNLKIPRDVAVSYVRLALPAGTVLTVEPLAGVTYSGEASPAAGNILTLYRIAENSWELL